MLCVKKRRYWHKASLERSVSLIEHDGKQYRTIFGNDVSDGRDGMYLELQDPDDGGVLGAYWSDLDGSFTFFAEKVDLPFEVVEAFR